MSADQARKDRRRRSVIRYAVGSDAHDDVTDCDFILLAPKSLQRVMPSRSQTVTLIVRWAVWRPFWP